jgi:hypothetical protein
VAAAQFIWEKVQNEAFGLLDKAAGRWECVDGYIDDDGERWQRIMCIVHIRKDGPLVPVSGYYC